MRGRHPILGRRAAVAALLLASGGGCQNQPMASVNPFLAPDRVPSPATRMVAPGTAQPYYQGDPLPAMHSSNGHAAGPQHQVAAATFVAPNAQSPALPPAASSPAAATTLAFSNEPSIAIPSDGEALRFAKPQPAVEPAPFTPHAASPVMTIAAPSDRATGGRPMSPYASQAEYDQPLVEPGLAASASEIAPTGPWRAPRVEQAAAAGSLRQPRAPRSSATPAGSILAVQPMAASPMSALPSMDVRLRAVPSPPPELVEPTTPRIRLPGYPAPARPMSVADGVTGQVLYQAGGPTHPHGGLVQTVEITPLASGGQSALAVAARAQERFPAGLGSRDGFRPRSSTR